MRTLLIVALLLSGCAGTPVPYGQVFIGQRLSNAGFESCTDENSGFRLGVELPLAKRWSLAPEYEHVSHLGCGKPFNNKPEDGTEHIGLTLTYKYIR